MAMAKRILVFLLINFAVMITLSLILSILGVRNYIDATGIQYNALLVFCLVFGMGGAFLSLLISKMMAKMMMGVKVIDPNSSGQFSDLVMQVHHMARAAGISKMPEVGIYESPEPNAFATGPSKNNALVAVSTGLLQSMNRDEVEGVLAHEVSHIANGDMVTMTLVQGVVNAFVMFLARVLAFAITTAMNNRSDDRDRGTSPFMQHMIVMLLELLLMPLGMIVVAYVSRIREYRADAGSASLVGKQKMIAALRALQRQFDIVDKNQPQSIASLKISGHSKGLVALFSTHPSLEDRIRALG